MYKLSRTDGRVIRKNNDGSSTDLPDSHPSYQQWLKDGNTPEPAFTLAEIKADQKNEIRKSCQKSIVAGVVSAALGAPHTYPTTSQDQNNMTGVWARSQQLGAAGEPYRFWCADADGVWARRPHTVAEIQQAAVDMSQHLVDAQDKYEGLLAQIDALPVDATEADVRAIVW